MERDLPILAFKPLKLAPLYSSHTHLPLHPFPPAPGHPAHFFLPSLGYVFGGGPRRLFCASCASVAQRRKKRRFQARQVERHIWAVSIRALPRTIVRWVTMSAEASEIVARMIIATSSMAMTANCAEEDWTPFMFVLPRSVSVALPVVLWSCLTSSK